ncbi:MAG: Na/Pi cotransporter family protein [Solobacterium sp.]|nr:Na/Pi cotransporter family protein [Solobacterium sp.]MDY2731827.1 Na/Pi cotransporter family protein [Erysipelotrichaceae bacterium]MDD6498426.1 Na/Pi cotransporter family protein [Solobacterium sp.]MDD6835254.1 Na/Pi cotransporter family protein [Solobacterium sp.]MDD6885446.1 Na/Pi cotransporter family protein [Solobacterium sp.]
MSISNVLALFSGVALFLYGMTLMGDGLKKVAGNSLEVILYKLSSNPLKGIALGAGVTAVIQSSSATSVMVVGFVNSKMMKVKQAIGIIMGAIIGTSITGWIVSLSSIEGSSGILELLSTDSLTAIIAIIGIYLRMFCKHTRQKQIGDIMMGFAVLMFGMKAMSSSVSGLRNSEVFINMLTNFSNPLIGILVGALFTAVIQSASAAVGILQALSATGAITFEVAFPMLMGIAVGASLPVLLSALGASSDGKRSAFAYLLVDVLGAVIIGVLFYSLNMFMHFSFVEMSLNTVSIALLNTVYRVIMVLMLAPCIGLIEKICRIIVKDDEEEEELYEEDRLEERFIAHPALAIEQCRITINNMALITRDNICNACALLDGFSDKGFKKVEKKEDIIDRYADKLGTYMVKVTRKELNKQQNSEISKYLHTIEDFERIGDHGMNIAEAIRDLDQKKLGFTDEAKKELSSLVLAVEDMLTLTAEAFINNDLKLAYSINPFESVVDDICEKLKLNHVERLKKGNCTIEAGIAFNDLITDLERIGDHCNNVFISMLEQEMDDYDMHQIKNTFTTDQIRDYNQLLETYKVKYSVESK